MYVPQTVVRVQQFPVLQRLVQISRQNNEFLAIIIEHIVTHACILCSKSLQCTGLQVSTSVVVARAIAGTWLRFFKFLFAAAVL
jgi:hypothetical protein